MNQITFGGVTGDGTGQTIAIVDAYNDPTITADLHAFDAAFGLANPSLRVVSQTGSATLPSVDPSGAGTNNWEGEEALDVEWAHAMAPGASIILVEANDASPGNLFAAINWARAQTGVSVISMSWGGNETSTQTQYDSTLTTPSGHQGVTFVASTGDSSAPAGYPAYSPNVVAVGGTSLAINAVGSYQSETGWSGSGGGISTVESQPSYQTGVVTQSTTRRTAPDVAFDANPSTGVSVYDSYNNGTSTPWEILGGTSVAAPCWAGIIAVADQGRVAAGETTMDSRTNTLPLLYAAPAADFHDVTTGNNGYAAGAGYDLVTGRGSPVANLLIPYLVNGNITPPPPTGPTIASLSADSLTVTEGTALTLTANGVSDVGGTGLTVTFYEENNGTAGLQTDPTTGDYAFTPVTDGSNTITLDTSGVTGTFTFYAQLTDSSGSASAAGTNAPSVTVTIVAAGSAGPAIGSVTAAPSPVVTGNTLTLTANNITDPVTSIRRVYFYEETNGIAGLQTGLGGDFSFRSVTAASGYSLPLDTTGVTGAFTFYAQAVDLLGNVSATGTAAPSVSVNVLSNAVPAAPTGLTATAASSSEIDLSFAESDTIQTGFTIQRSTDPTFATFTQVLTINRSNVFTYSDTGLTPSTQYYYRVQAFDAAGSSGFSNVANATTPAVNRTPLGSIDIADGNRIAGWGFDADAGATAVQVRLDIDGVTGTPFAASVTRPDLTNWLGSGNHGYSVATPANLGAGTHTVTLYVQDYPGSSFIQIAQKTFNRAPMGSIDIANGSLIAGWAFDWDAGARALQVRLDIDGVAGTPVTANVLRGDLTGWLGSGNHGYMLATPTNLGPGVHTVTLYTQDYPNSGFVEIAQKTITRLPMGSIDIANATEIAGWAFDWEAGATPVSARLDIDGVSGTVFTASTQRPDLAAWLGSSDHGYVFLLPALGAGSHTISLYVQDSPSGAFDLAGQTTLVI